MVHRSNGSASAALANCNVFTVGPFNILAMKADHDDIILVEGDNFE